jgi:hypothetical protein
MDRSPPSARAATGRTACEEWSDCAGACSFSTVLGGYGNVDDNVFDHPDGSYRGAAVRLFDTVTGQWSIWWGGQLGHACFQLAG